MFYCLFLTIFKSEYLPVFLLETFVDKGKRVNMNYCIRNIDSSPLCELFCCPQTHQKNNDGLVLAACFVHETNILLSEGDNK